MHRYRENNISAHISVITHIEQITIHICLRSLPFSFQRNRIATTTFPPPVPSFLPRGKSSVYHSHTHVYTLTTNTWIHNNKQYCPVCPADLYKLYQLCTFIFSLPFLPNVLSLRFIHSGYFSNDIVICLSVFHGVLTESPAECLVFLNFPLL